MKTIITATRAKIAQNQRQIRRYDQCIKAISRAMMQLQTLNTVQP